MNPKDVKLSLLQTSKIRFQIIFEMICAIIPSKPFILTFLGLGATAFNDWWLLKCIPANGTTGDHIMNIFIAIICTFVEWLILYGLFALYDKVLQPVHESWKEEIQVRELEIKKRIMDNIDKDVILK